MTTPTPAALPEMIALKFIRLYTQLDAYGPAMKSLQADIAQAITAAHAQGRAEGVAEQMEKDCEVINNHKPTGYRVSVNGGNPGPEMTSWEHAQAQLVNAIRAAAVDVAKERGE